MDIFSGQQQLLGAYVVIAADSYWQYFRPMTKVIEWDSDIIKIGSHSETAGIRNQLNPGIVLGTGALFWRVAECLRLLHILDAGSFMSFAT